MKFLHAAAMVALNNQISVRDALCKWIAAQTKAGSMTPLLYMDHVLYDEAPMTLNVHWGRAKEAATTKVLVIDAEHFMLVQCRHGLDMSQADGKGPEFLAIRGRFSPFVRALDACTAEGLQAALATTVSPPLVADVFQKKLRLSEVDECPANLRCEGLM